MPVYLVRCFKSLNQHGKPIASSSCLSCRTSNNCIDLLQKRCL